MQANVNPYSKCAGRFAKLARGSLGLAAVTALCSAGLWVAGVFAAEGGAGNAGAGQHIDFIKDVQPILKASCVECHDAKKHKAALRLDNRADAYKGGDGGKSIVPGHSKDSLLIQRLVGQGDDPPMPFKKPALPKEQIETLTAWIDQGAEWPESADGQVAKAETHWAYAKPVRPALPDFKDPKHADWCRNAIDRFVVADLEKEGLQPSPEADRATLIRRVTLDLIGVPPTVKEADDFVNDKSPDAYEKVVDRLLASPHYGERAALRWLDLARYADSNGYEKDRPRSMWPYRDWVINALNADMGFDQFTIEQVAGDLLPNATAEQQIATGFNRNTMINEEGGADPDEFFYYANVDRVSTTATVFLGSTLACAQCHNHKFDPFLQKDYYQFLGYFNSTAPEAEKNGTADPHDISAKLTVEAPGLKPLRQQVADLQAKLNEPTPQLEAAQAEWEKKHRTVAWMPLQVTDARSTGGATLTTLPDGSVLASGESPETDTYTVVASTTSLSKITAVRLEVLPDDTLPGKGPGRAPNGNFVLTHLGLTVASADGKYPAAPVALKNAAADFSQESWPVQSAATDKADRGTGWAVSPNFGQPHSAVFETPGKKGGIGFEGGTVLTFTLQQNSPHAQHNIGRFRLSATSEPRAVAAHGSALGHAAPIPSNVQAALETPADQRSDTQKKELAAYYRSIAPELQPIRDEVKAVEKRIASYPVSTLVMKELAQPRESHIHLRGGFLTLGDKVEPGIPALFREAPGSSEHQETQGAVTGTIQNRLDLARWLVSPENPLTARVTVNRLWEQHFGKGIVATSEDFGTQGDPPTHPALLDWLATEFMHPTSGKPWSMKAMHRLIVTSATYRQSSDVSPALAEKDPPNKLLARGPRFRLPAELIRDEALAVSGLLSDKIGGPSVFPIQPAGIWNSPYSKDQWVTSEGEDRYRRGIYTFLRRSAPYPAFMSFDKTTHEAICTRRSSTDTPLQALTTLNDPAFMQPAAALARKILSEGGGGFESRVTFAFRTVLTRQPEPDEVKRLVALYEQMLQKYQADSKAAEELATSGLSAPPKEMPVAELAAWTMVSNVLLNLDETLTVE